MKLIAVCVISHERPKFLELQMKSIALLRNHDDCVTTYLFDNSVQFAQNIADLAKNYQVGLLASPGASQVENFRKFFEIEPHSYYMLLHDDDIAILSDVPSFLSLLRQGDAFPTLFYVPSITINDQRFKVVASHTSLIKPPPLGNSIVPWVVPAFSSWIYPHSSELFHSFQSYLIDRPLGKFSDVLFVDRLIASLSSRNAFRIVNNPYMLNVLRWHSGQDSWLPDYGLRFRLISKLTYRSINSKIMVCFLDYFFNRIMQIRGYVRSLIFG